MSLVNALIRATLPLAHKDFLIRVVRQHAVRVGRPAVDRVAVGRARQRLRKPIGHRRKERLFSGPRTRRRIPSRR